VEIQASDFNTMILGSSFKFARRGAVVFAALVLPPLSQAEEACALQRPPLAAAVNAVHGSYVFIFPRQLDVAYTGCQSMWDQRGARVFTIRFENGSPTAFEEHGRSGTATLTCNYSSSAVQPSECPSFDDVRGGFRTIPAEHEPQVPRGVDPRGS